MRYRYGFGANKSDPRATAELVRYVQSNEMPEMAREAIWEKILRLEGFRLVGLSRLGRAGEYPFVSEYCPDH
jgi:hypothetical protein